MATDEFIPDPDFHPDPGQRVRDTAAEAAAIRGSAKTKKMQAAEDATVRSPITMPIHSAGPVHMLGNLRSMGQYPLAGAFVASDSPEDKYARDLDTIARAKEMFANMGGQVVGSAAVPVVGAAFRPLTSRAGSAVGSKVGDALSSALENKIQHMASRHLGEELGDMAVQAGKKVVAKTADASKAAGQAGVTAVRSGAVPQFSGTGMSNAIDRLRASAVGNPRAAELWSKIEALRVAQDPSYVPGGVTQSTGVNE